MSVDYDKLNKDLDDKHEDVRRALASYSNVLAAAVMLTKDKEREHHAASQVQVESAKRVLWMD